MTPELEKYHQRKIHQEHIEHRDVLLSISAIIQTKEGRKLFEYLFKNFEVGNLPDKGLEGIVLHEYLGFMRAGNSIYKLACEAASEVAANILAKTERERYEDKLEQYRIEHGLKPTSSDDE